MAFQLPVPKQQKSFVAMAAGSGTWNGTKVPIWMKARPRLRAIWRHINLISFWKKLSILCKIEKYKGYKYQGELHNGRQHGQGHSIYPNGHEYFGQFENGYRHGKGLDIYPTGCEYTGEFRESERRGKGVRMLEVHCRTANQDIRENVSIASRK